MIQTRKLHRRTPPGRRSSPERQEKALPPCMISDYREMLSRLKLFLPTAVACLVYLNSLFGDFVHDDIPAIVRNPDVTGENPVARIFRNDFWGEPMSSPVSHKSYRPITVLIFRLNFHICHQSLCFHATNIVLHGCATLLLTYICLKRLRLRSAEAVTVAGIFAIHPIHTEAVSGLVGCADLLACNFTLLSFLLYTRLDPSSHLFSLGLSAFAMLSKETGIASMAINVGFVAAVERGKARKKLGVDAVTLCLLVLVRLWVLSSSFPQFSSMDNPASFHPDQITRLLTFLYLPVHNFWLLVCPSSLSYDWQMGSIPLVRSLRDVRNIASVLFYMGMAGAGLKCLGGNKQSSRAFLLALLFLVLPFIPATNLLFPVGFVVAERILYAPSIGFCLLVGLGISRLRRLQSSTVICLMVVLLAGFTAKTVTRNQDWMSREALFRSGLRTLPLNAKMHYNMANVLREKGQREDAVRHYRHALRLWPDYVLAHNNLATILESKAAMEDHLRAALHIDPGHQNSLFNLAVILSDRGSCESAIPLLERCLFDSTATDRDSSASALLYRCLRRTAKEDRYPERNGTDPWRRRYEEEDGVHLHPPSEFPSVSWFFEELDDVNHGNGAVHLSRLAEVYMNNEQWEKARILLGRILEKDPSHKHALYQLSQVYLQLNSTSEALDAIRSARLSCDQTPCHTDEYCRSLCLRIIVQEADVLREAMDFRNAAKRYHLALEQDPEEPSLLLSLGSVHHALGEYEHAWNRYRECLRVDPQNKLLRTNMERLVKAELAEKAAAGANS